MLQIMRSCLLIGCVLTIFFGPAALLIAADHTSQHNPDLFIAGISVLAPSQNR